MKKQALYNGVAPRVGAWIETVMRSGVCWVTMGRAPRGRVD